LWDARYGRPAAAFSALGAAITHRVQVAALNMNAINAESAVIGTIKICKRFEMSEMVRIPSIRPEHVGVHAGANGAFLVRCVATVNDALRQGQGGLATIAPQLFSWITDERNLRVAWDYLAAYGGQSPGPNGLRYADLAEHEVWSLMRCLRDAIRASIYHPGPIRRIRIPKLSGSGHRIIALQNIEDRVVARAIVQIIQPILDPKFDAASFGYRPGLSRTHAVATAEMHVTSARLTCWIVDDGRDAFDQISRNRLLDVLKMTLPDNVTEFIQLVMTTDSRRGVRQGSPLSPLLLNVYLDHFLDQPWRRRHPEDSLIRSADDILICCENVGQAQKAYQDLKKMMTAAGMPLKGDEATAIHNLSRGQNADWLGYQLNYRADDLVCRIAERAWKALPLRLEHAHSKPCSPLVANQIIKGWFDQLGPCFRYEHIDDVVGRVRGIAADVAFDEIPTNRQLRQRWRAAFDRWCVVRDRIRSAKKCSPII